MTSPLPAAPRPPAPRSAAPLAAQWRSGRIESQHDGHLVVVDRTGRRLVERGDPDGALYARSSLKPVQALPLLLGGAAAAFDLPDAAIAIATASHAGDAIHRAAASALLARAGLGIEALQCGSHPPLDTACAEALIARGLGPDALHSNCSGKHAGMLAVCVHQGWDTATYRSPDHPLQQQIRALVAELAGLDPAAVAFGVDGCGVPVWHLPLASLALVFARLADPSGLRPALAAAARRVTAAMRAHPELVSGHGRLDTRLMAEAPEPLIAKIGGEGVHAGGLIDRGWGWAIKVSDGNRRAIGPALQRALAPLGCVWPAALADHLAPACTNHHGDRVGEVAAAW